MPATRRRSSASISKTVIEQAKAALQELPEKPKDNLSLKEAIASLKDTITAALDRGYSYEEVAEMLSKQGVKISPTSLKSYLSATLRSSTAKPAKTRGRKRQTSTEVSAETTVEMPATPAEATPKRRGRKPKATTPESVAAPASSEAPAPSKRGTRAKTVETTKTAAKRTPRSTTKTAAAKPTSSTRGRRKKAE